MLTGMNSTEIDNLLVQKGFEMLQTETETMSESDYLLFKSTA